MSTNIFSAYSKLHFETQKLLRDLENFGKTFNEKVTEEYKREMLEWYTKGRAVTENPMKRATQEHWYSLYLEKKRLERHSCKVEYASYDQIAYPAEELTKTNLL